MPKRRTKRKLHGAAKHSRRVKRAAGGRTTKSLGKIYSDLRKHLRAMELSAAAIYGKAEHLTGGDHATLRRIEDKLKDARGKSDGYKKVA